jgi:hypothetical protein
MTNALERLLEDASRNLKEGREGFKGRAGNLRQEAATHGEQLLEEARRHGAELLALAARHGIELAREYGLPLLSPRPRRRRSRRKLAFFAILVTAIAAVVLASRD